MSRDDAEQVHVYFPLEQADRLGDSEQLNGAVYSPNVLQVRQFIPPGPKRAAAWPLLPKEKLTTLAFIAKAAQPLSNAAPFNTDPELIQDQGDEAYLEYINRIRAIVDIALQNGHDTLVLGALGCGAFGNDPAEIAEMFNIVLTMEYPGAFRRVVFAYLTFNTEANLHGFQAFEDQFMDEAQGEPLFASGVVPRIQ